MSTQPSAYAQLLQLARDGASGELIAANGALEIHVYLQAGRIAWGTTNTHPLLFSRTLREVSGLDEATLQRLYEECRRSRRPLGEALISGHHATFEDVRGALAVQIRGSIAALSSCATAPAVFLRRPRSYSSYDPALTFGLEAFEPVTREAPDSSSLLTQLDHAAQGLGWGAVLSEGAVLTCQGALPAPAAVFEALLSAQALLVSVRTSKASTLGVKLAQPGCSLWCSVESRTGFGPALGFLLDQLPRPVTGSLVPPSRQVGAHGAPNDPALDEAARRALWSMACPAGVAIVSRAAPPWAVSSGPAAASVAITAAGHQQVLDADLDFGSEGSRGALQTAMVADAQAWWFGVQLAGVEPRSAWVTVPRTAERSIGWAVLRNLSQDLAKAA